MFWEYPKDHYFLILLKITEIVIGIDENKTDMALSTINIWASLLISILNNWFVPSIKNSLIPIAAGVNPNKFEKTEIEL